MLKICFLSFLGLIVLVSRVSAEEKAHEILEVTGIKGGLIVHLGCGNGKLTAALGAGKSYLVHGLDQDAVEIEKARKHIHALGLYGRVSVEQWTHSYLPYADNLVNLFVAEDLNDIPISEVMRVLAPNGVAYIKEGGKWKKVVKPWPEDIDEWTHFLHGPDNNAVARDRRVGFPARLQWLAGPLWSRLHESDASVSALVSARGRMFYIVDEGPSGLVGENIQDKWFLAARDAFSGVLLWKRRIERWGWREWKKSWQGWKQMEPLQRRLVAVNDRIYVTLGYRAPLTALDAATGKIVKTYKDTGHTDEILYESGTLYLVVKKPGKAKRAGRLKGAPSIMAIDAKTGAMKWRKAVKNILPFSLAVDGAQVFFINGGNVTSLKKETGKEIWISPSPFKMVKKTSTLVVYKGAVLLSVPERGFSGNIGALSVDKGKQLWTRKVGSQAFHSPNDVFGAGGLVWVWGTNSRDNQNFVGLSPLTGEIKKDIATGKMFKTYHHHRCYRNKATERYILTARRGVEFVDLSGSKHMLHNWVRGTCRLGVMPCNGLLYASPHPCTCYLEGKLKGFCALAAAEQAKDKTKTKVQPNGKNWNGLEKGPAYGKVTNRHSAAGDRSSGEWATYRHDEKRSGVAASAVPDKLSQLWAKDIGSRLTPPVMAAGKVFVAATDRHKLYALSAKDGSTVWTFTAGGRIDSPPTIHEGQVLFGCRDGWAYCLRASDGELVWRFRAAPLDRRAVAYNQLESVRPVHGSILITKGTAYFAAGRSSFLDGGIRLYGLEPQSGRKLYETQLRGPYPDMDKMGVNPPFHAAGSAKADIMLTDGTSVFMRQIQFSKDLKKHTDNFFKGKSKRLYASGGFLDDTGFHRTYWAVGRKFGQLLIHHGSVVYGVGAYAWSKRSGYYCNSPLFFPGKEGYLLFSQEKDTEQRSLKIQYLRGGGIVSKDHYRWSVRIPVRVRAMVLADKKLFIAGPPDIIDPKDPLGAFEGRKGACIWVVSPDDGKKLSEYKLDFPPVFDGMIAAGGRIYISMRNGRVLCVGKK